MLIDFCWHATCVEFLTISEKKVFPCVNCGLRPNVLVIDGIAVGLDRCEDIVAEELADKGKSKISGSEFSGRMFVKLWSTFFLIGLDQKSDYFEAEIWLKF